MNTFNLDHLIVTYYSATRAPQGVRLITGGHVGGALGAALRRRAQDLSPRHGGASGVIALRDWALVLVILAVAAANDAIEIEPESPLAPEIKAALACDPFRYYLNGRFGPEVLEALEAVVSGTKAPEVSYDGLPAFDEFLETIHHVWSSAALSAFLGAVDDAKRSRALRDVRAVLSGRASTEAVAAAWDLDRVASFQLVLSGLVDLCGVAQTVQAWEEGRDDKRPGLALRASVWGWLRNSSRLASVVWELIQLAEEAATTTLPEEGGVVELVNASRVQLGSGLRFFLGPPAERLPESVPAPDRLRVGVRREQLPLGGVKVLLSGVGPTPRRPAEDQPRPRTGVVKWFNDAKGFGFIEQDSGEGVFVHFSAIKGAGFITLTQGERVEFDVIEGPTGLTAERIKRLER